MAELLDLRALHGPNIFYPQPAVAAVVADAQDVGRELAGLIKDWAQAVGLIVGLLRAQATAHGGQVLTEISFTCSLPALGAEVVRGALADLEAAQRSAEDYSHDDAVFALLRQRKREEPGLALLQLRAEAMAHGLPLTRRPDGRMMLGRGRRGWSFDPAALSVGMAVEPPWETIGSAPLVALSGVDARELDAALAGRAFAVGGPDAASAHAAITDERAAFIIIVTTPEQTLAHGLPFERCTLALIGGLERHAGRAQMAAGLPALTVEDHGMAQIEDTPAGRELAARIGPQARLVAAERLTDLEFEKSAD